MRRFAPDELAEIRTLYRNAVSRKKQMVPALINAIKLEDLEETD